ncbi:MAG: CopG family transcriptional regulator [Chloroflexota bacterium]
MTAEEFDQKFDDGEEIIQYLDLSKAVRGTQEQKSVNIDFPVWMIRSLEREANRLGITLQAVIKVWLAERLDQMDTQTDASPDGLVVAS